MQRVLMGARLARMSGSARRAAKERRQGVPVDREIVMTWLRLLLVMLVAVPLAGCELVGDIFQAGMAVGVIMILAVIGLIAFVVAKIKN